ncbi:hypothetical protein [Streptomyces sp. NPDC002346]
MLEYTGRKDQQKGFDRRDFRNFLLPARTRLGGPILLVRASWSSWGAGAAPSRW